MPFDDANAFLGSQGAKAFPFEAIGDQVTGTIIDAKPRQQTNMETGEPEFWRDGSPKMLLVVTLQTTLADDATDDGIRSLWLRGGNYSAKRGSGTSGLTAFRDAIKKATGKAEIEAGATLTFTHSGLGEASSKGFSAPKLYEAVYAAPTASVDLDDLFPGN